MAKPSKSLGIVIGVVALVLTGLGIAFAATNNASAGADAALAFPGHVPNYASANMVITTGHGVKMTGTAKMDFAHSAAEITVNVPAFFSMVQVDARLVGSTLYVTSPALQESVKRPWISVPLSSAPDFFPIQASLATFAPNAYLLSGLGHVSVVRSGPFTTYSIVSTRPIPTNAMGLIPTHATILVSVRTAGKGQLADVNASVGEGRRHLIVGLHVTSYVQPVHISAPPASEVQSLPSSVGSSIANGKTPISQLLTPSGIASLGQIQVH